MMIDLFLFLSDLIISIKYSQREDLFCFCFLVHNKLLHIE